MDIKFEHQTNKERAEIEYFSLFVMQCTESCSDVANDMGKLFHHIILQGREEENSILMDSVDRVD